MNRLIFVLFAAALLLVAPVRAQFVIASGSSGSGLAVLSSAPTVQTGTTYTLANTDSALTFNGSASTTLTLGSPILAGRIVFVRTIAAYTVVSASSNIVPLAGGAAGTAILAATAGKWAVLLWDGTAWQIIASN